MNTILGFLVYLASMMNRANHHKAAVVQKMALFYATHIHPLSKKLHERDRRWNSAFKAKLLLDKQKNAFLTRESASGKVPPTLKQFIRLQGASGVVKLLVFGFKPVGKLIALYTLRRIEGAFLTLEMGFTGATISSVGVAISIHQTAVRNDNSRSRSFRDVIARRSSSLFAHELTLWIFAGSSHIEDVIGDFRESYESRKSKRGEVVALSWAREQVLHEVWHRITWLIGISRTAQKVVHWLKGHLS